MRVHQKRSIVIIVSIVATLALAAFSIPPVRRAFHPIVVKIRGKRTVEQRVAEFTDAQQRLRTHFDRAHVAFPPAHVTLLALKDERRIEVYAGDSRQTLRKIVDYPVLAASGSLGPKLREGDRQVPEGVYALESLNPDSKFHVALRVGYPNVLDKDLASRDGRSNLGGDIMIHGGRASIGCLAMGDDVAEEMFILAARVGLSKVSIVIAPVDMRHRDLPASLNGRADDERYAAIGRELAPLSR